MKLNDVTSSASAWFDVVTVFMALATLVGAVVCATMLFAFLIRNNGSSEKGKLHGTSRQPSKSVNPGSGYSGSCKGGSNRGSWFDSSDSSGGWGDCGGGCGGGDGGGGGGD